MTKPDWKLWPFHENEYFKETKSYEVGWANLLGFSVGWEHRFKEKWLVEIYVGGGLVDYKYESFSYVTGERTSDLDKEFHHEFWPYKGGVNIGYLLGGNSKKHNHYKEYSGYKKQARHKR